MFLIKNSQIASLKKKYLWFVKGRYARMIILVIIAIIVISVIWSAYTEDEGSQKTASHTFWMALRALIKVLFH